MPAGGPRDVTPPAEEKSIPPNYSKNFKQKRARIYFDEFVTLKDVASQVIISPPMDKMPLFHLRGKSLVIDFNEEFKGNTTYTIFLGSAIADITEGNIISSYEYVFSTGNTIDSLSIKGKVVNAFDIKPEKDVLVMLYQDNYDSIPYKEKPYYLTRTDEEGQFALNNLGKGRYKIFALKDANSNYLYDLPNEAIAFSDSLITATYYKLPEVDSLRNDTIPADTNLLNPEKQNDYQLALFEEPDTMQRLVRAYSPVNYRIDLIFLKPTQNPEIRVLNHNYKGNWYLEDFNKTNDTLTYWITDPEKDTLLLKVSDAGIVYDTVEIIIYKPDKEKEKIRKKDKDIEEKLSIRPTSGRTLNYFDQLELESAYPLIRGDFSGIILVENEDTLQCEISFKNNLQRVIFFDYDFKENMKYSLFIPDSAFTDILNRTNDTIIIDFVTNSPDEFGLFFLKMRFEEPGSQYIIQILTEKEKLIRQQIIDADKDLEFDNLKPGKYLVKAILDLNRNGKWDTGDYIKVIQPERVYNFPAKIHIRSKWEIEEEWTL